MAHSPVILAHMLVNAMKPDVAKALSEDWGRDVGYVLMTTIDWLTPQSREDVFRATPGMWSGSFATTTQFYQWAEGVEVAVVLKKSSKWSKNLCRTCDFWTAIKEAKPMWRVHEKPPLGKIKKYGTSPLAPAKAPGDWNPIGQVIQQMTDSVLGQLISAYTEHSSASDLLANAPNRDLTFPRAGFDRATLLRRIDQMWPVKGV